MKAKYIKFCKRCNTETEHYACGDCVVCNRAYMKSYRQNHRTERSAYQKDYYQVHRIEKLAYYQEHRIEKSVYHKNYHKTHLNNNGYTYISI